MGLIFTTRTFTEIMKNLESLVLSLVLTVTSLSAQAVEPVPYTDTITINVSVPNTAVYTATLYTLWYGHLMFYVLDSVSLNTDPSVEIDGDYFVGIGGNIGYVKLPKVLDWDGNVRSATLSYMWKVPIIDGKVDHRGSVYSAMQMTYDTNHGPYVLNTQKLLNSKR